MRQRGRGSMRQRGRGEVRQRQRSTMVVNPRLRGRHTIVVKTLGSNDAAAAAALEGAKKGAEGSEGAKLLQKK